MIPAFLLSTDTVVSVPFDDTIVFSLDQSIDNNPDYHYTGNYVKSPTTGKVLHFFSNGDDHFYSDQKKISGRLSSDNGQTFGSLFDLYIPESPYGVIDSSGGYGNDGRLHIFAGSTNGTGAGKTRIIEYVYSDDDGSTFSSPVTLVSATSPVNDSLLFPTPYQGFIENNGVLLKPFYKIVDAGDASQSANYLLRSSDNGANWSYATIRAKGASYFNETDIIALDSSNLLAIIRDEDSQGWQQYRSDDNGLTWSSDGAITFGETTTQIRPPSLRSFFIKNQKVIVFYGTNQNPTHSFFGVYAKASDLISSGLSAWNLNTKTVFDTTSSYFGWYGNAVHYEDNLKAKYVMTDDEGLYTISRYMTLPTTQYQTIISELGL